MDARERDVAGVGEEERIGHRLTSGVGARPCGRRRLHERDRRVHGRERRGRRAVGVAVRVGRPGRARHRRRVRDRAGGTTRDRPGDRVGDRAARQHVHRVTDAPAARRRARAARTGRARPGEPAGGQSRWEGVGHCRPDRVRRPGVRHRHGVGECRARRVRRCEARRLRDRQAHHRGPERHRCVGGRVQRRHAGLRRTVHVAVGCRRGDVHAHRAGRDAGGQVPHGHAHARRTGRRGDGRSRGRTSSMHLASRPRRGPRAVSR